MMNEGARQNYVLFSITKYLDTETHIFIVISGVVKNHWKIINTHIRVNPVTYLDPYRER